MIAEQNSFIVVGEVCHRCLHLVKLLFVNCGSGVLFPFALSSVTRSHPFTVVSAQGALVLKQFRAQGWLVA
jgi:hypothetical protein